MKRRPDLYRRVRRAKRYPIRAGRRSAVRCAKRLIYRPMDGSRKTATVAAFYRFGIERFDIKPIPGSR